MPTGITGGLTRRKDDKTEGVRWRRDDESTDEEDDDEDGAVVGGEVNVNAFFAVPPDVGLG